MPFLQRLTQGARIPEARLKEVAKHYEQTGGFSPYNEHAGRLLEALKGKLQADGVNLPVFLGMRNWRPFLEEALREIHGRGLKRGLAVVLAPHRSEASFGRYARSLEEALKGLNGHGPSYEFCRPWHEHPLFIQAQADRVRAVLGKIPPSEWTTTRLLFTAHSIPVEMAAASSYAEEIRASSQRVAEVLGIPGWSVAYQSRSGPPQQPWLEPDLLAVFPQLKAEGARRVVAVPIGFLFDHTEVLYDLDLEARAAAQRQGLAFHRAQTVMDHPQFVGMLKELAR